MASDALLAFTALDELIQLIYQGASRFVVISRVDDHAWTLHVGLSASGSAADGRWWRGRWTAEDILGAVGTKSSTVQERFADGLRDAFVGGQLHIENWSSHADRGVQINVSSRSIRRPRTRRG
ncbi:hypothetical protein PUNSTDRAFT_50822 [Punctularia strigosozonata HHB-11173 SS5]|uniref:uncharacterized protein n=1 Tax=Punctularia strigosozonata (strain HHB-11173) TaxID=741275 RepID=UPI000441786A|nr:uncharacterized protein PUNSTDRAFT_50822 [Punctularia strigosozonata HHB-11173 SS5]EIN12072.1 hypothetical protein PUNSTDRAFT_50822 [Punctularia strigosozonata HHB-11173 SS5]